VTNPSQPPIEEKPPEAQTVVLREPDTPIPVNPPRDKAHLAAPPVTPSTPTTTTPPAETEKDPTAVAAAKEKELGEKLGTIGKSIEGLAQNLTITTGDSSIKVLFGGSLVGDFLFNTARPVAPGTPFFLTPRPIAGFNQQTFDGNARQSLLFAYVSGPQVCGFETSGVVAVCFYDGSIIQDIYGVLPLQAYAQMKNDDWRFAAGLQLAGRALSKKRRIRGALIAIDSLAFRPKPLILPHEQMRTGRISRSAPGRGNTSKQEQEHESRARVENRSRNQAEF
jgi:hypothetical protein